MCLFRRKKTLADKNLLDREAIEKNSKLVETLLALVEDSDFKEELKKLQEQLKYLIPSTNDKIFAFDKKIKENLEDMKILLTKSNVPDAKAMRLLTELRVNIAERNANI